MALPQIKRGLISRPQRAVIYAAEGLGKTTLASQLDSPIFLDFEKGTHHIDVPRFEPETLKETEDILKELAKDTQGFKTVVIDTVDWLEELVINDICKTHKKNGIEDFGYGKGHVFLAERFGSVLALLDRVALKMNVLCLAHAQVKKFEAPDSAGAYDRYELKLGKHVSALVKEWCDALLFGNWKTRVKERDDGIKSTFKGIGGKERMLYASHSAFADAKNRHNLKEEEPWGLETLNRVFTTVSAPATVSPLAANVTQGEPAKSEVVVGHETKPSPVETQGAPEEVSASPSESAPAPAKTVIEEAREAIAKEQARLAAAWREKVDAERVTQPAAKPIENTPPTAAEDTIPGLPTPLDPVFVKLATDNEEIVNGLLIDRKEIKAGETWRNVSPDYVVRVLRNPAGFLAQCVKLAGGAK
jgi:hypothetical protein